jgi:hypothetical protein
VANKKEKKPPAKNLPETSPWIQMRTGLVVMGLLSLGLAAWTTWNLIPDQGLLKAILWGLAFGFGIWLVFLGAVLFNRWTRRR